MASNVKTVDVDLPAEIFDVQVNIPLIHQVVVAQQAAARQGTHDTKSRGEVRGGGRKPYKQKGTGRARQGSTRAPQFTGGGTVHGPVPRSYVQRTPKKMKAAALRGALSDRARDGRVHIVDSFVDGENPRTKVALETLHAITEAPRRYGFHGTLKAPFHLRDGTDEAALMHALDRFGGAAREQIAIAPVVRALETFIAIVPRDRDPALDRLASDCVTFFDPFRAPLSERDRARREPGRLSERQREHLDRWGYPYVFEDFRFHMTLTGPVPVERHTEMAAVLETRFGHLLGRIAIDSLSLFVEEEPAADFRVHAWRHFDGAAEFPTLP